MPAVIARARWGKRSILWLSLALLITLITFPLALFARLLFSTTIFTIHGVTVVDARPHTSEAVKALASDFVGKNIFLITPEDLEDSIVAELSQVHTVHVTRKLPGVLKIVVQEKTPAVLLATSGNYYFVDINGIVFEEARLDTLPGIVLPIVKNTDSQTDPALVLGAPALDQQFVAFVVDVQRMLPERLGLRAAEIRTPALSAREVTFVLDNNWLIRFDTNRPADRQITVLQRLLDEVINEEERQLLEYVDLRIQNRVYYRTR